LFNVCISSNKGFTGEEVRYLGKLVLNSLLKKIQTLNNYFEPAKLSCEFRYNLLYQNLNTFYFLTLNELYKNFTSIYKENTLVKNLSLYKNQYRPMKKGVTNMVKLHATGAVAMPIEVRLHILASSKDVIHSWAIPSAGIKIDCVPGYSSHRVAIFLVSGIF
jgi:heme/copper-type cytochrome/quinol oxidase subunit 2